eukprot:1488049-Pleurochrysis_carterae.AAC.1
MHAQVGDRRACALLPDARQPTPRPTHFAHRMQGAIPVLAPKSPSSWRQEQTPNCGVKSTPRNQSALRGKWAKLNQPNTLCKPLRWSQLGLR